MAEVLLIDDDCGELTRDAAVLTAQGHSVRSFPELAAGLAALRSAPPDVLVLEPMAAGTPADGLAAVRTVAREFPVLPLIALTRMDDHLDAAELARQDVDGWLPVLRFIRKPVAAEVLVDEVDHALAPPS